MKSIHCLPRVGRLDGFNLKEIEGQVKDSLAGKPGWIYQHSKCYAIWVGTHPWDHYGSLSRIRWAKSGSFQLLCLFFPWQTNISWTAYFCEESVMHCRTDIVQSLWVKEKKLKKFKQEMTRLQRILKYKWMKQVRHKWWVLGVLVTPGKNTGRL